MNVPSYYVTLAEYPGLGLGNACDPTDFDGACDAYAEARNEGKEAVVFRYDPPVGSKCGAMIDVTADAHQRIASRLRQRQYQDFPDWLLVA